MERQLAERRPPLQQIKSRHQPDQIPLTALLVYNKHRQPLVLHSFIIEYLLHLIGRSADRRGEQSQRAGIGGVP